LKTTACFDNFFFGGTNIRSRQEAVFAPIVSDIIDSIYTHEVGPECPANLIDVSSMLLWEVNQRHLREVFNDPELFNELSIIKFLPENKRQRYIRVHLRGGAPELNPTLHWERVVVARLISDHLPVSMNFEIGMP
jgi:hypothetical protein